MTAIRDMEPGDIDALVAIEQACFAAGYADKMMTAEDFAEVPGDEHVALFCAVEGAEVAGYAFLLFEDGAANFDSLAVSPSHQGKGLGPRLIAPVLDRADAARLPCWLESTNPKNHTFYRRCGFEIADQHAVDGGPTITFFARRPR